MTNPFQSCQSVSELLGTYGGAVSTCWEDINAAGVFQSEQACQFAEQAEARLFELLITPVDSIDPTNTDAYAWTTVFMTERTALPTFGSMLTWFANAIEAGRNAGRRETCPHTEHAALADDLESCRLCGKLREQQ